MKQLLLLSLTALTLSACATPTVYGPAATPTAVGYSETPIEQNRWRITFHGGSGADARRVGDLALLRAADLTVAKGYDWFQVTDRYTSGPSGGGGPYVSLGGGGASFGHGSAVGVGGGLGFDLSGGPSLSRTIEVVMGKGTPPQQPDAYDAREVRRNLGPSAQTP